MAITHAVLVIVSLFADIGIAKAQALMTAGQPAELDIRPASTHSIRITLKPISLQHTPDNPALADIKYQPAVIAIRSINQKVKKRVGGLMVEVSSNPLTVKVTTLKGLPVQQLVFENDGTMSFNLDDRPVLGMGEGGAKPGKRRCLEK